MRLALGLQRNSTASAISSGLPKRPIGMPGAIAAPIPGISRSSSLVMLDSTHVGQTQLTRISSLTLSSAGMGVSNSKISLYMVITKVLTSSPD